MKLRFAFFFLSITALVIGIGLQYNTKKNKFAVSDVSTVVVKQGEFIIGINDTGIVKAKKSSMVLIPQLQWSWGETKVNKLLKEGSYVKKGDPICWLDTTNLEKQLKDSEFQLKMREANLKNNLESLRLQQENRSRLMKERKLDWDSAKLEYELEKKKYDKTKRLVVEEILPQQDLENEQRKFRASTLKVDQTEKEYLKAAEQQASDEKMKEIDIEQTKSEMSWYKRQYDQINETIDKYILYAPADGLVVYQKTWSGQNLEPIKEGDTLWPGQAVAFIPDLREIQVMTQVAETDLSKIKLDMPVRMKMDSIPDLTLAGKISQIGNLAMERERSAGSGQVSTEESAGIKVFELTIDVVTTDFRIRSGMTCKVNYILENFPSVISIPIETVHIEQSEKYVLVKKDGKVTKRSVILGKQNDKQVIVDSGLNLGEEVCLPQEGL